MSQIDLSALAEQLCRIEHKVDLIVEFLAKTNPDFVLRPIASPEHTDPITQEPVSYQMDYLRQHAVRRSSDGTGLIPHFNLNIGIGDNNGNKGPHGSSSE